MLDHHLQRDIVYRLAFAEGLRFSQLKPDEIENKLFDYHLKKTVAAGYVRKNDNGEYVLTPDGRKLGLNALQKGQPLFDQAYSILILAVRRKSDKAWLLCRRNTHPLLGRAGFMRALPIAGQSVTATAARACREATGVVASFRVLGSGLFTMYDQDNLESYTNFTFLVSDDAEGELQQNDPLNEFFWAEDPDFTDPDMLPNMKTLGNLHKINQLFFVEKTFRF
jgi:hypothetical protein